MVVRCAFSTPCRRSRLVQVALLALWCGGIGYAQVLSPVARQQIAALLTEKDARTPVQTKLDSQLRYAELAMMGAVAFDGANIKGAAPDSTGYFTVDISANVSLALLSAIGAQGGQIVNSFPQWHAIRARIPGSAMETVAGLPGVNFLRPAERPMVNDSARQTAAVVSRAQRANNVRAQLAEALTALGARRGLLPRLGLGFALIDTTGDKAHRADVVRSFGFNGSGVKVGVLSDGVNPLATMQNSGDLPAVTVLPGQAGSGAEGTAMLQIVYNLAPGAQLYFAQGGPSQAQFATNIVDLRAAGCDVIIDDITFFAEGVFQDGTVAQAVNSVVASGALYFSSAGNEGRLDAGTSGTWEGDFVDSGSTVTYNGITSAIHDFGGGLIGNRVNQDADPGTGFWLKWSDPLGASSNDYDFFLVDSTFTTVVGASTNIQNGTQDPWEFIPCPSGSSSYCGAAGDYLVIVKRPNAAIRALNMSNWRGRFNVATGGCTFGHNAGANTISMAAVNVGTAGGGAFTGGAANPVEPYSCDGPRRIFYNPDGTAITPGNLLFSTNGGTVLHKPDLAAADCTPSNTPGFGNPFCGTSAAAPHAGAIATLVKSARPSLTAGQIHSALNASALDIMAPGIDVDSGLGIVMALGAVQSLTTPVTIASIPAGLAFSISGSGCPAGTYTTPSTLSWDLASNCTVNFPSPQTLGATHYSFAMWLDGPTSDPRIIATPTVPTTYTALLVAPPGLTKSFGSPGIALNSSTTAQFTLSNPNTMVPLTGVGFVDNLPPGMTAAGPVVATGCPGSAMTFTPNTITLSGLALAPLSTCTYSLTVTGSAAGVWNNVTTNITSFEGGPGGQGSATLTVVAPPKINKSFGVLAIPIGGGTTLTFSIENPNFTITLAGLGFTDTLPSGLLVAPPNALTGSCGGGTITAVPGSGAISLTGATLSAGNSCTFSVGVVGTAEGMQANTTSTATATGADVLVAGASAKAGIFVGAAFQLSYAANLAIGESYIDLSNSGSNGASLLGPGAGGAVGNICVNVYGFSPDEQLISCCSCLITPNAIVNLGVVRDMMQNTLTGVVPSSVAIMLVSTLAGSDGEGTACTNTAAIISPDQLAGSTLAWGTTVHSDSGSGFAVVERPFAQGTLSAGELASLTRRCAGILGDGSSRGVCASCRQGESLGAK